MLTRVVKSAGALRPTSAAVKVQKAKKIHTSTKAQNLPLFSAATLAADDAQLAASKSYKEAREKFSKLPSAATVSTTKKALEELGHSVTVVADKKGALEALQTIIPSGASINLAGSTTLVRFLLFPGLVTLTGGLKIDSQMALNKARPRFVAFPTLVWRPLTSLFASSFRSLCCAARAVG